MDSGVATPTTAERIKALDQSVDALKFAHDSLAMALSGGDGTLFSMLGGQLMGVIEVASTARAVLAKKGEGGDGGAKPQPQHSTEGNTTPGG